MTENDRDNAAFLDSLPPITSEVTSMLLEGEVAGEERASLERMLPLVYEELRVMASRQLRKENAAITLQTTALVNEACLRMLEENNREFANRRHFFFCAARAMRYLLVEHARRRHAQKRGSGERPLALDDVINLSDGMTMDLAELVALGAALARLETMDARQCCIVEMRFFAGLTNDEIGEILNISSRTVKREWAMAKRWLGRELGRRDD